MEIENNNKYDIQDLIVSALEQKPDEFAQSFNGLMVDRLNVAIADKKNEIARTMFTGPNDEEDFEDTSDEQEDTSDEYEDDADQQELDLEPEE